MLPQVGSYNANAMMFGGSGGYGDGGGDTGHIGGGLRGSGNQYNMQTPSPNAPVNEGGPGNPNGASNMSKPQYTRPVFGTGGLENNKGPAPLGPQDYSNRRRASYQGYDGGGINPGGMYSGGGDQSEGRAQQLASWQALPAEERARYDQATQNQMNGQGDMTNAWQQSANQYFNQPQNGQQGGYNPMNTRMGGGFGSNLGTPNGMPPGGDMRAELRRSLGVRQPGPVQPTFGNQVQGFDPYSQYGNAGQSQQLGRYVPPMMQNASDPSGGWLGGGGYSYNIPNSYGSGQWNQFNSRDVAFPQFGQSQNMGQGSGTSWQGGGMPNPLGPPGSQWPTQGNGNFSNNAGGIPVMPQSPQ